MWHHVAFTYAYQPGAINVKTYLDGSEVSATISNNFVNGYAGLTGGIARTGIGNFGNSTGTFCTSTSRPMYGAVDDICVISKILTAGEVMTKYMATNPVVTTTKAVTNEAATTLLVYPNPTTAQLTIAEVQAEWTAVELIGIDGRVQLRQQLTTNTIDLSTLPKGMYVLVVRNENNEMVARQKVVKN
jgi:hypothetical protein